MGSVLITSQKNEKMFEIELYHFKIVCCFVRCCYSTEHVHFQSFSGAWTVNMIWKVVG